MILQFRAPLYSRVGTIDERLGERSRMRHRIIQMLCGRSLSSQHYVVVLVQLAAKSANQPSRASIFAAMFSDRWGRGGGVH